MIQLELALGAYTTDPTHLCIQFGSNITKKYKTVLNLNKYDAGPSLV
jgi:hypothetical protein